MKLLARGDGPIVVRTWKQFGVTVDRRLQETRVGATALEVVGVNLSRGSRIPLKSPSIGEDPWYGPVRQRIAQILKMAAQRSSARPLRSRRARAQTLRYRAQRVDGN